MAAPSRTPPSQDGDSKAPPKPAARYSDEEIQAWADACNACDNCLDIMDDEDGTAP